jgi:hypothetical protein
VAALRAAVFINQADRHGTEPRIGFEPVDNRSQQPCVKELRVVEEHDRVVRQPR